MKRKKWSELEEKTLLSKYSELLNSGVLSKLKTREKKFKPIADHVNSLHNHQDPITFPFKWSWRDVSIKVQNMRHQYLGVKQKIRISNNEFNWDDGEIHWENFLKYREVFGDIELVDGVKDVVSNGGKFGEEGLSRILGDGGSMDLGYAMDSEDMEDDDEEMDEERASDVDEGGETEGGKDSSFDGGKKRKKGLRGKRLRVASAKVLELRDMIIRREEKRRERDWSRKITAIENETERKERESRAKKHLTEREESIHKKEMEFLEMQIAREKREAEKQIRLERELEQERRQRMKLEEKWEEEELEWRERLVEVQIEHEKQMMQMHADACQNQLQILGVLARVVCQFFGSGSDGLSSTMGTLPPQVLQNLQHQGGLGDSGKPDPTLPSEFL